MSQLLEIPEEVYKNAPKFFDRTEESLKEDVATVKQWIANQPHIPEMMDDEYIRNFLILNKCSIEKAKQKIDMYYTSRTVVSDIFQYSNFAKDDLELIMNASSWIPLPKMTPDFYRVTVTKLSDAKLFEQVDGYKQMAFIFDFFEIRLKEDYMFGDIIISDMSNMSLKMIAKWTPALLSKTLFIYDKVFSSRLKALYLINTPSYIDHFLVLLKTLLKPKLVQRIHVCTDHSILLKELPAEIIPKDFGGQEKSVQELQELWRGKFEQFQGRFDTLSKIKVNEELRPEQLKNDDMLGFHGNFKKLDVD